MGVERNSTRVCVPLCSLSPEWAFPRLGWGGWGRRRGGGFAAEGEGSRGVVQGDGGGSAGGFPNPPMWKYDVLKNQLHLKYQFL